MSGFNVAAPKCACEDCRTTEHSPRPVKANERLVRFGFDPIHFNRKGEVKPSLFSHVEKLGCSVQRDDIASDEEIRTFVRNFLSGDSRRQWKGVFIAKCEEVRSLIDEDQKSRAFCVYDTAEPDNPAHAEICQSMNVDEGDGPARRRLLMKVFEADQMIRPVEYRSGTIV